MNRRTTMLLVVSVVAAMIVAYGAVTGLAAVGVSIPTGTNAIVAQPALFAATAGATGAGPVAVDDSYSIVDGLPLTVAAPGVLGNDSNAVRVVPATGPAQGALTLTPTGAFTYDPMGTTGTVTFTYQASDGTALSSVAVVTITVSTTSSNGTVATNPTGPDGAGLYAASCAVCHNSLGITVNMGNAAIVDKVANGSMAKYAGSFSAADIQAIADYLAPPAATTTTAPPAATTTTTTTAPPATTTATTPPATGPDGAGLYAASCAVCHNSLGITVNMGNAAIVDKVANGSMAKYAGSFSAADIQAIADYLAPPAGGGTPPPANGVASTPPPAAPTTGDGAYASFCAACHGADGTGTALGPDIVGESSSEIYEVVRQGDGTMPAFSASVLSDKTLAALVDYMATFGPGSDGDHDDDDDDDDGDDGDDSHGTSAPSSSNGASVYTSSCAACHGADGRGTPMGPDIVGESSSEIYEVVRQGDGTMPAFSYQVLSDGDLTALADYIASWGGGDGDHSSDGDKDDHDDEDDDDD